MIQIIELNLCHNPRVRHRSNGNFSTNLNFVSHVSGNGYDGTNYNVTFGLNRAGRANAGARFNGSSSYVLLPTTLACRLSGTNPTSVSVWMQTTAAASDNNRTVFDTGFRL